MAEMPDDPPGCGELDEALIFGDLQTRRKFLRNVAGTTAAISLAPKLGLLAQTAPDISATSAAAPPNASAGTVPLKLKINGRNIRLDVDPRTSLLDLLRETLHLTGSKKGCDHGQCGACTVLVNERRINSCLSLAAMHEGDQITTIEGLASGDQLHPVQAAFIEHDGFQCGYCTPGQICSAVALLKENHANSDEQIREFMSGNICRCGAYPNIVDAIKDAKGKERA